MKIFFSGPLTNLTNPDETKAFYEKLDAVAKTAGCETFWAYKNGTDPIKNPEVSPAEVYQRDIKALESADIMISYITEPSTGTGIEIEHADEVGKPVVLIYKQGTRVSRMLRGCPAVKKEIIYTDEENACNQLAEFLSQWKTKTISA